MIQLVIAGRLAVGPGDADGQLDLPREPPWPAVEMPTPAAAVTVSLDPGGGNFVALERLFGAWYRRDGTVWVVAGDGRRWIEGAMRCHEMTVHQGIQATRSVLPPVKWRVDAWGRRVPYRDQPVNQPISKPVREYVLAAERYAWCAPPGRPVVPAGAVLH